MNISPAGIAFIKANETCSLTRYPDPPGSETFSIGWGHFLGSNSTLETITQEQADYLLESDLRVFVGCINARVNAPITQPQFDALVDFAYNEGTGAVANSTWLLELNAGNYGAAADALLLWNKDKQHGVLVDDPALLARRKRERAMFLSELPPEPAA